jgi:hypothetical protein
MDVRDRLLAGEFILSEHPPFYLTSMRLLHHGEKTHREETRGIPIEHLITVDSLRGTRHSFMIIGGVLLISGFVLAFILPLYTTLLAIPAGIGALVMGSIGKTVAYQIKAQGMPKAEESIWRLPVWGADQFVNTIRNTIAQHTRF